jgi:hypothetical protein
VNQDRQKPTLSKKDDKMSVSKKDENKKMEEESIDYLELEDGEPEEFSKADAKKAEAPGSTRFKRGKSGNPRGRPRKEHRYPNDTQIFYDIVCTMEQSVTVTRDGKKKKVPAVIAVLDVLLAKGLKGDFRSLELLLDNWKSAIRSFSKANVKLEELIYENDLYYSAKKDHEVDKRAVADEWIKFHNSPAYKVAKMRSNMTIPKRRG